MMKLMVITKRVNQMKMNPYAFACITTEHITTKSMYSHKWQVNTKHFISNLAISRSSIIAVSIVESLWNFAKSVAVILQCSVQSFETIGWQKNKKWANMISRELGLRCVWNEYPILYSYDDVIKWKPFPRYWPFVQGIHRSPVNSRHKCQWRGALVFSLICAWINGRVNNRETDDLRSHRAHYGVMVM